MECSRNIIVGNILMRASLWFALFFIKATLPSGPCESSLIQVEAGGRAPLSSLEINVPGLFFSFDSNHLFLRLTFFARCCRLPMFFQKNRKKRKSDNLSLYSGGFALYNTWRRHCMRLDVGERIKNLRTDKGLTQDELAERLNVSRICLQVGNRQQTARAQ